MKEKVGFLLASSSAIKLQVQNSGGAWRGLDTLRIQGYFAGQSIKMRNNSLPTKTLLKKIIYYNKIFF
jgi:hypothetical protein